MMVRGCERIAELSNGIQRYDDRLPIYYDYRGQMVITKDRYEKINDKSRAFFVTELIRPNTAEEIKETVTRWLMT